MDPGRRRLTRLAAATVLCYLVGYGLVLAGSGTGWVFVVLGGPLLLATGICTIRQVQRGTPPGHDSRATPPR